MASAISLAPNDVCVLRLVVHQYEPEIKEARTLKQEASARNQHQITRSKKSAFATAFKMKGSPTASISIVASLVQ